MAELIQNQVGITRGSIGVLSAITNWLENVHPSNTVARAFRKIRGNPDNYDTMMNMVIDGNCNTHVSWNNFTSNL